MSRVSDQKNDPQARLITCREAVKQARAGDNVRKLCLALIDLGAALFHTRQYEVAVATLNETEQLAATVDDPHFEAHCLGLSAAAYQDIGRFHNAYEVIERVVMLAETHSDKNMQCDALITQAQILANSGEPVIALDKLKEARALANQLDDKRHLMKTLGALGSIKTTLAALEDAQTFFEMAAVWASQLGEQRAECGYLLNLGTVLAWQKVTAEALPVFERALTLAQELDDQQAELAALRHMTGSLHKTGLPERVPELARRGIALAQTLDSPEITFAFFETLALAHYRTAQPEEALRVIEDAIAHARAIDSPQAEVTMLLHLGESCMALALHEQALDAYQRALAQISQLDRAADEAHLVGRVGVALAELGRVPEAIAYHQRAVELARARAIPELEGEQLTMLALAYRDQRDTDRARSYSEDAIAVFASAGLDADAAKARDLLAQLFA